ncbi:RYR1 [Symbiodinium natans]|uniref:RYR1 protein n=1 Tax=Symbiodinium natans TaxID=878477 RepID=A0A812RUD7_9DINO|nr:RYR1 [Symbiodinium natans]
MMRSRLEPQWVSTMSKVLAAIINRKPESIKSPFQSLLMYLELAMKRRAPDSLDYRVLTPLVSVYADFLEAGWTPTYEEMEVRPKYGATRLRDPQNEGAKTSDLYLFALLLVNSSDPLMRAACMRAIRVLGGRTARKQPVPRLLQCVNICMLPPDPKTQKPYQGLPPQGLSIALPRKSFHMAPFAYSMWLYMQDEVARSESGTRIFHIMSHATPASTVPQIQLFLAPGPGRDYSACRFEVRLGASHFVPDEGTGGLKRHTWAHVCLVLGRRHVILYVNAELTMQKETSGMQQFSNLRGPQRGTCYVGIPPPDVVPYHAMNWFFPGYIFELAYHDEGLSASQVQVLHAGGRRSLPLNLSTFESAEDTESCCIYPYVKWKPTPLHWLVTSDIWEKLEGQILTLLASKVHLMNETEVDEFQLEAVRALRCAASHLLAACFDLDEVCSRRLRQWAVNFSQVKSQVPPVIKLHLNDESFSFEFKLRFRQYSNLEEGAKVQTIMANVNEKLLEAMAGSIIFSSRRCAGSISNLHREFAEHHKCSDTKNCWFLTFVYFQNVTQLKLPPQTGPDGWLHCTIGYVDGKTELAAAWDGEEPRITIESYTKDMFRTEAYLGCEVQITGSIKKICNQLLCDLAYVRVWDNYEPAEKLNKEFADAGAPNAMLVAGNQAVFVCLMPIIHEDRGYILDAVPMSADVGPTVTTTAAAQKSGPNTKVFPSVRSRYNVSLQWPGCLFCSQDYVPIYTAPRAISEKLVLQASQLRSSSCNRFPWHGLAGGHGQLALCTVSRHQAVSLLQAGLMIKERGAYQFQWLIHHPSSVNGSIKKEQCAVGLLLQNDFSELYRASCATLDVTLDTKMVQQTPDKRFSAIQWAKESVKISLTRRGCILRMQLLFVDSALWISMFLNDVLIDAQCLVLPPQSVLERLSQLPMSHVTWPSFELGVTPPAVSSSNSIYAAYCNFRDFEAEVLPNPSNDIVLERINIPLMDPRADKTRAILEPILEGTLRDKDRGEVRFPEDMLLLAAMCSSEQIWRFMENKRKESLLYLAIETLLSSQATFMGLAEATKRKRYALLALGSLLRFPHTYEALFDMGFLQVMANFLSTGLPSVHDEASDTSGLTARLSTRALRADSWKNRLQAARNMYSLLCTTAHLLPPVEAPTYVDTFIETRLLVGTSTQERSEVSYLLQECQDATAADLGKFTDALRTYSAGAAGLRSPGSPDNASVILSVLKTLTHMIGRDETNAHMLALFTVCSVSAEDPRELLDLKESEHQAQRLKMHASSNIYECCIPIPAATEIITFDNIPIGNGSVEILEGGIRRGIWSRFNADEADTFKPDTFQWRFKYESEEILSSVQDLEDSVDRENKGYRFVVRPVWDTDDEQTILARRQLILDKPGFMKLLTSLHSQAKGLGPGGEKVQNEVDLKVVMLLSFLAQRGDKPPHPAMISEDATVEKIVFQTLAWSKVGGRGSWGPASSILLLTASPLAKLSRCRRISRHFVRNETSKAAKGYIRALEKVPPAWYQAVEVTLIGICVACFCFGETNPSKALFVESEPWFGYSTGGLSIEDVINLIFCAELVMRAWANDFQANWFLRGSSITDLVSCLPVLDRAFALTPSSDLSLELTLLRSIRFVRIFRLLKSTAVIEDREGRRGSSLGLSVVRILVSAVGTLSISAGLLWRVEGRNGINPAINSFGDACFYMLNVFTSQGAPFPVTSTEGRFVTSVAIVIGLLSLPVQVNELFAVLRSWKTEEEAETCEVSDSGVTGSESDQNLQNPGGQPTDFTDLIRDLPTSDRLGDSSSAFLGISVKGFCDEAGVGVEVLEPQVAESDLVDFFTVLEDPATAGHIAADPRVRIKLAAALIRRKKELVSDELGFFRTMFQLLETRPSIEKQCGVGGKRKVPLDRQHISVARFYHGISSSEEGRQHFAYHQEAIMRIVDIANNNTQAASKPDCQPTSHQALCYDGNYIIRCLTNFSNKPSKWALTTSLNLLRPKQHAAGWMCEFARGEVVWSLSLHIFLMDEHQADMPAIVFYKGTSPSEVQLAVGVGHATTVSTETKAAEAMSALGNTVQARLELPVHGQRSPYVRRYTHDGRLKTLTIPNKFVEIYRWAHLAVHLACRAEKWGAAAKLNLDSRWWPSIAPGTPKLLSWPSHGMSRKPSEHKVNMAVVMNGELIHTHTLQCELMAGGSGSECLLPDSSNLKYIKMKMLLLAGEFPTRTSGHLSWCSTLGVWQVYQLMLVGGRAMEPQHAKEVKARDELKAWHDNGTDMQHFDHSRIGLTGADDLPDPVHLPGLPVQIFDARLKVASEEGIEDGIDREARLELIKHIVKQHPDSAVTEARAPIVVHQLLMLIHFPENVECAAQWVSELRNARKFTEEGFSRCLADPSVGAMTTFFRFLTSNFTTVIRTQDRVPQAFAEQFTALDQGEKFQRFMQQMIRRKDDRRISGQHLAAVMSDLSHFLCMCRWCQIAAAAKVPCVDELCAATVPRQLAEFAFEWKQPPAWPRCNQRRLMATLCAIRDDDLSVDEQVLVAQAIQHVESRVPHAGLSHLMLSVVLVGAVQLPLKRPAFSTLAVATKPIQAPDTLRKARASETGLGQIMKLRVPGAPGLTIKAVPQVGENFSGQTRLIDWSDWQAKTESALQQPVEKRKECRMILAHTRPLKMELAESEAQKAEDKEHRAKKDSYWDTHLTGRAHFKERYKHDTGEPVEVHLVSHLVALLLDWLDSLDSPLAQRQVFQLDFQDTIYYQLQFMSGKRLDPFLEKDDIEMVSDEPPKVVIQGLTQGMVSQDTSDDKSKGCREWLDDDKQDDSGNAAKEDPTGIVRFMNSLLKCLITVPSWSARFVHEDIDAAATKDDADNTNVIASMSYVRLELGLRLNSQLRPIQRILALAVLAVATKQPHKFSESMTRILTLVDSLDPTVAQSMCDAVLQLLNIPRNLARFTRANVEKVLSSMTQAFYVPEKAEWAPWDAAQVRCAHLRVLKPEAKDIAESKEPASSRIISPLLAILQKAETSQEQRAFIFNIIRQGMRYEIVSAVSFTSSSTQKSTKTKGSTVQPLLQVLRPLERSVDRLSELENFHDLFRDLSVAFSSASVLKKVCLVSHPEGHAMLIVEDVVPKLMRVIGEIKDFLPRFKHLWQTHVRQDSFSDKSTWRLRLL